MKKKKRFFILILEGLILIFIVGGYIFFSNKKNVSARFVYEDYEILILDNEYCQMSHTGIIDLEIRQNEGETDKLLCTSDDMIHDGSNIIVDKNYSLQLQGPVFSYVSEAYETKYKDGVQCVTIYYINHGITGKNEWMDLSLVEVNDEEHLLNMRIETEINTDAKTFIFNTQEICVTNNGIMFNASTEPEMYNSISMITGIMEIQWKDRNAEIALRPYAEIADYSSSGIIKPKVRWAKKLTESYSSRRFYVVELEDWENIEKIVIGSCVYEPKNQ